MTSHRKLHETERHTDRRRRETRAPAVRGREDRHDGRAEQRPDVDAHVEDRKPGVATRAAFRIDLRDDRADVWFEQPDAERDEDDAEEEELRRTDRQQSIADHDEDAAPP